MKNFTKYLVVLAIVTISLVGQPTYASSTQMRNFAFEYEKDKPVADKMSPQQAEAQIEFFKQAIDELGAATPEDVVRIWAKAEKTRNGVFHYAVACDELKSKIIKEWGKPQDRFWIIGTSSPWLDKYQVVSNKKINDSSYEAVIKYYWVTSAGPSEPTQNTLLIVKNKDKWCVKEVR